MNAEATGTATIEMRARQFADDPASFFGYSYTNMHSLPRLELEALQLAAVQYRFAQLHESVPMVNKFARAQGITRFERLEDVVPMLFEHTMYKSYPPSLLENNRFDLLARWLDKLTAHDLSKVDVSACKGLTDWIQVLDEQTPMKITHSSGTSGIMSFVPLSKLEWDLYGKTYPVSLFQEFGDPGFTADTYVPNTHVLSPNYRYGASSFVRGVDMLAKAIAGSEERLHSLYAGRLDSDAMYLAARIRAAKAKGNVDSVKVSPELLARYREFAASQANAQRDMDSFFERIVEQLTGQRIFMLATWNVVYDLANAGLKRGLRKVFAPNSVIMNGGGAKGLVRPEGWQEPVLDFTGVARLKGTYAMSEVCGVHVMCALGHFHFAPWVIPFLLDPDTGQLLPRTGVVTGRASFYDLLANSHWGGFISGDELTVHWDGDCACGMTTAYAEDSISRYSDKRGGDDKISCAATPEALSEAIDFLAAS